MSTQTDFSLHSTSTLSLYNSQARTKQRFTPLNADKVGLYVCGMTVYDYCHIGHARVMVAFDILTRWLRTSGYQVNYVRNITDIDDKIIKRANENGESITALTTRFIAAMHEDACKLGCATPDHEPKATDYIEQMQDMISQLIDKKHAYAASNGDVYYAVDSFADYGKLSGRQLEDMVAGASERNTIKTDKKHPFDFVLWKSAKPNEPHWQSPWGTGRPGWHIECSAMSTCCLGHTFDIHGGGHDLQFPHHENEIAQSEAATGQCYANTWMHVGFVNVDGEKMSKSLGNFFTIREVLAKYPAETVRYFIISSHYRSPINFSDTALDEAHAALSRLYTALKVIPTDIADQPHQQSEATVHDLASIDARFKAAMDDDLNTAGALAVMFELARDINRATQNANTEHAITLAMQLKTLAKPLNILQQDSVAFLQAATSDNEHLSSDDIEEKIAARQEAKANKNYQQADEIRQFLTQKGVVLEDSHAGTTWRRE